ncbi:MAG TPA: M14 family metallopeptidase [Saprospiraceae bacterium]|nr:M14 family metallopeptidase [Saprospiraceae bacterium]HMP24164.1 M14 family metallopeptidase [Saprospiraceae bacterium]
MKKQLFLLLAVLCCWCADAAAQHISVKHPLTYYLPDISYNASIPTPEQFFGFQIGEWHLSHDLQLQYMKMLAEKSPRVTLVEYARSYEQRPLVYLAITSESNHQRLDDIQAQHIALSDPARAASIDIANMPSVLYQGFSIHGNEPSGGNAAPLVAYYLAAGQGPEVENLLANVVILLDPCFNPDGFNRFASWANSHRNHHVTADPTDREYREAWPGGRTNHYWFDLNRDWLPVQHPESRGRIVTFHQWKPNVLTDHHEQGTNATYFFMPGVPSRTNPITPWRNQELTEKIGNYHAAALDKIGSLYFTKEGYDDFYFGKGSTYPDANGAIGILFEQASSRGHAQESDNGLLTFPFTIRNQVTTAFSTHKAMLEMRRELLEYQRDFYKTALNEAKTDKSRGYVFGDKYDAARVEHLLDILLMHKIEVFELSRRTTAAGQTFEPGSAYVVPTDQAQYRLIRGIFETQTRFDDSLFYDISTWTIPMAFNLPYASVADITLKGKKLETLPTRNPTVNRADFAYLLPWDDFYAPATANYLMSNGLRTKVAAEPFTLNNKQYSAGTVLIPVVQGQTKTPDEIYRLVQEAAARYKTPIDAVATSLTPEGIDLGSRNFALLQQPKVLLLVGEGVSSYDIGEAWHLLDQRYEISVTKGETSAMGRFDLSRYNVIVMASGSYAAISEAGVTQLKTWLENGGTLVAMQTAVQWLRSKGLSSVEFKRGTPDDQGGRRAYGRLQDDSGSNRIPGSIFEAEVDLTHPLLYGYHYKKMPIFRRGNLFFEPAKNAYATPMVLTAQPLLSGYANQSSKEAVKNSAVAVVSSVGSGKVINFADNPNFRAFWLGTNKLFANALFFGHTISSGATDRAGRE